MILEFSYFIANQSVSLISISDLKLEAFYYLYIINFFKKCLIKDNISANFKEHGFNRY